MADKLKQLEERVERQMKLLRAASDPKLDPEQSQRIKAAIRRDVNISAGTGSLPIGRQG